MPNLWDNFRNFITSKKKYVLAYSNWEKLSWWREDIFKIKSHLSWIPEKDRILYLKYNYFRLVSKAYTDYEIGEWLEVLFEKDENTKRITNWMDTYNIMNKLYAANLQKSKVWYVILRVRHKDWEDPILEKIPVTNYFCSLNWISLNSNFEDIPEHNIMSFFKDENWNWFTKLDTYTKLADGKWLGVYAIYDYSANWNYSQEKMHTKVWEEILEHLPLFLFNSENIEDDMVEDEDIRDSKQWTWIIKMFFAESDYKDIFDIIQDINDRCSQISVEFIKHLSSKMSIPKWYFDSLQNQNMAKIMSDKEKNVMNEIENQIDNFDYITHWDWESPAQYITKDSSMLDKAFVKIERDIRAISTFTSIPVYMLWLESASWNRHVWTDQKDSESFLQKIKRRRNIAYSSYQKLFAYVLWSMGYDYQLPTIKYAKLPNWDLESKVSVAAQMKDNWFLSQKSLIKFVNNFDEEERAEEKKQIDAELKEESAITLKDEDLFNNDKEE